MRTDRVTLLSGKVSTVQGDILASNTQLADAAIPVQDLHLTLFVLTLKEQDGSLQVKYRLIPLKGPSNQRNDSSCVDLAVP